MDCRKSRIVNNGGSTAGDGDFMANIVGDFSIGETLEFIMDGDALAEGLMDGFTKDVVEMGFPAEDKGETVKRIVLVIHEHLKIVEDSGGKVLSFVNRQKEGLALFFVEIIDLLLNGLEHTRLTAFVGDAEEFAELPVELRDTDGREADVVHTVKVWIERLSKGAKCKSFTHTGTRSKNGVRAG